jgi:magnesium chelatase subunit D
VTPDAVDPWADALLAAQLVARDPRLGGAVVRGPAGPSRDAWVAAYRAAATGPVLRLPLGIDDDRLLGGIDLAATLAAGCPVAARGLLVEAAGGTLIVAMAERIDAALAGRLAAAVDGGEVRLVLLDEGEGDEAVPPALSERCGLWLTLHAPSSPSAAGERGGLAVTLPAPSPPGEAGEWGGLGWGNTVSAWIPTPPPQPSPLSASREGREQTGDVALIPAAIDTLCATAFAFGIDSARAAVFAVRAARGCAALAGRNVGDDDIATAARLVLGPRATRLPMAAGENETPGRDDSGEQPPDTPPASDDASPDHDDDTRADATIDPALTDRIVAATAATLPPGLVTALAAGRPPPGRGSGGGAARAGMRGRPLPSRAGNLRGKQRLKLVDTLRAAAPWQTLRRPAGATRVIVRRDDFRIARFAEQSATTTIFAVDASGSAAIARLAEAKGAVELLLAEAYVTRAHVALVAFRGTVAEVVLPPTRSLARAKRALAGLAGGGGTPLAAGLDAAGDLARAARRAGRSALVVVLTDGRANIARDGTASRDRAAADAITAARGFATDRITAAFIDTSVRPRPEGAALAAAMGARYVALPVAGAAAMAGVIRALAPA